MAEVDEGKVPNALLSPYPSEIVSFDPESFYPYAGYRGALRV